MTTESRPTCFIAMPITVHDDESKLYGDPEHWSHVMNHLFIPAIEKAGYEPIIPSAVGSSMIHARIVNQLIEAEMVLCDLSQHNPNVLFELGVRTSLNRPIALVKDEHRDLPFDIRVLNTHHYQSRQLPWTQDEQIETLAKHIQQTATESQGENPLWKHFGVAINATNPPENGSPTDAKLQLILERMETLEARSRPSFLPTAQNPSLGDTVALAQVMDIVGVTQVAISGNEPSELIVGTDSSSMPDQEVRAEAVRKVLNDTGNRAKTAMISGSEIRMRVDWGVVARDSWLEAKARHGSME